MFGALPKYAALVSLFIGIWPISTFGAMASPHLLQKLVTNFDVWYVTGNVTFVAGGMFWIVRGDIRMAFVAFWWLSTVTATWFDAAHSSAQKYISFGLIVGSIATMTVIPCLHFGVFPEIDNSNISLSFSNVEVSVNVVMFVNERIATVLLFFLKNLFTAAVRHPGCFVNIKARLTHKKYSVGALGKKLKRDATTVRHISTISAKSSIVSSFVSTLKIGSGHGQLYGE